MTFFYLLDNYESLCYAWSTKSTIYQKTYKQTCFDSSFKIFLKSRNTSFLLVFSVMSHADEAADTQAQKAAFGPLLGAGKQ